MPEPSITTLRRLRTALDLIPDTLDIAEPALTPPAAGPSDGQRMMINEDLTNATRHLHGILVSWVRLVSEERPAVITCTDQDHQLAAWLWNHSAWIADHPAGIECADEIEHAVHDIRRICDRGDPRVFVGTHAGMRIYAKPDQDLVTLPDGTVHRVDTLRKHMLASLPSEALPLAQCAAVAKVMFGFDVTAESLRKLVARDQGKPDGLSPCGPGVFQMQDVLDRLAKRRTRRAS